MRASPGRVGTFGRSGSHRNVAEGRREPGTATFVWRCRSGTVGGATLVHRLLSTRAPCQRRTCVSFPCAGRPSRLSGVLLKHLLRHTGPAEIGVLDTSNSPPKPEAQEVWERIMCAKGASSTHALENRARIGKTPPFQMPAARPGCGRRYTVGDQILLDPISLARSLPRQLPRSTEAR